MSDLARYGFAATDLADVVRVADWVIDPSAWARWQTELATAVDRAAAVDPRRPWLSVEAARQALHLPDAELVIGLAAPAGLVVAEGQLGRAGAEASLGAAGDAMASVVERLTENPFAAPERTELAELGLSARDLATAARTGLVLRLSPDLVVAPDALERAVVVLAGLPQPFTASAARQALGTTRRVAIPLLELLDRNRLTELDEDGLRTVAS